MCALESLWIQPHRSCQATCSLILEEKPSAAFSNTAPFLVCHSMSGLVQKVSPHFMWLHYIFLEVKKLIFFAFLFFVCGLIFIPTVLLKYDFLNFYLQTNKKKTKQKPKQTHTTPPNNYSFESKKGLLYSWDFPTKWLLGSGSPSSPLFFQFVEN